MGAVLMVGDSPDVSLWCARTPAANVRSRSSTTSIAFDLFAGSTPITTVDTVCLPVVDGRREGHVYLEHGRPLLSHFRPTVTGGTHATREPHTGAWADGSRATRRSPDP